MEFTNQSSNQKQFKPKQQPTTDLSTGMGKVPPQAVDLEQAVLGALMLEKDALTSVIDILKPENFYRGTHQRIYNAIRSLFEKSEPVDMLTVKNQLKSTGELELVGGAYYITELTTKVNSAANIEYHARIIVQQAIKRELIQIASQVHKEAYEDTTDVFELLDKTEQSLFEVSESSIRKNYSDMRSVMHEALDELEAKKSHEDGLTGIPSGFTDLDRVTSGWQKSDLVILAARPGMGKTAFILSALRNASVDFNNPVAIFSLEMSAVQLVNRLISSEAELESEKIKKGTLADYEWEQLHHKISPLTDAPIYIDDTPALPILELRAKCRRLKAQHDIQLIIVDYLQLMTGDQSQTKATGNREQEIASISRSLKNIAKELNVPVIALSQLSRAVETRGGDKRPQLADLRESGSIEQDADLVGFLYRPEYYNITEDEEGKPTQGTAEVIIAKHRNGQLDNVTLRFIGKYTKFTDLDDEFGGLVQDNFSEQEPGGPDTITLGSKLNQEQESSEEGGGDEEEPPF